MEKPLSGIYRISFDIELDSTDELSSSDLSFLLTEGVGEGLASKLSHLSVEKMDKTGKSNPKVFKVGDKVQILENIKIKASIYEDGGYFYIGQSTESANLLGEQEVMIVSGSYGWVNQNKDGKIVLVDLDIPVTASLIDSYTDEVTEEKVNVDFITLSADILEKVNTEGDK